MRDGLHVRVCIQPDGSVKYTLYDYEADDYATGYADPEWIGACFAGADGTDRITAVEVAGVKYETHAALAYDFGGSLADIVWPPVPEQRWYVGRNPEFKHYHGFPSQAFNSLKEAEAAIAGIALVDPIGVDRGCYYIDGPEEG